MVGALLVGRGCPARSRLPAKPGCGPARRAYRRAAETRHSVAVLRENSMAGNSALKRRSDGQPRKLPPGLKLRCALPGHEDWVHQIVWSPDGQMLASVSNDTTSRLWNIVTRE